MTFSVTSDVKVTKDDQGGVRKLYHSKQPYQPEAFINGAALDESTSVRQVADAYLKDVLTSYDLNESMANDLSGTIRVTGAVEEAPMLRYVETGKVGKMATVAYTQTVLGLPVWNSGMTVKTLLHPPRVIGSQSSVQRNINVQPPLSNAPYLPSRVDAAKLANLLDLDPSQMPTINSSRLLIYQLDADDRGNGTGEPIPADETNMHVSYPTLALPDLPSHLVPGRFYVVSEVLFSLTLPESGSNNWGAFIDPKTGSVLRLDVFVGCVDGYVYVRDPVTKTGDPTLRANSATSVLDSYRDRVPLDMLTPPKPSKPQHLISKYVQVRDVMPPYIAPPTQPKDTDFLYSVPTDEFAAVNGLYHCDRLFTMMVDMGFSIPEYFNGTTFPVPVDHRWSYGNPNMVNAMAPGNISRNGSYGFRFALNTRDTKVGMAVNWRVTLHEFGHAILWDTVHSPNFRFAHSAGDSLAAILNDPDSRAPDRFRTFPWTIIRRRHDRRVEDGWGWGGRSDNWRIDHAGYLREQILSSTLFRYYRAIGGDHSDHSVRHTAARYTVFMILTAVGNLSHIVPPQEAEDFADELMEADENTEEFEGILGGMTHKVIRWAFERQGLYQPPGAPKPTIEPGSPPEVDVYIDDGRGGGYDPQSSFLFTSNDIWNRREADDGLEHQKPQPKSKNYLYVRVKNRGTREARDVIVKMFTSTSSGERLWPREWAALDTASVSAKGAIPPQGETIVGPFEHATKGYTMAMLASVSADGDKSNAESVRQTVPVARLTHYDNNIAGRIMRTLETGTPSTKAAPPLKTAEAQLAVKASAIKVETWPNLIIPDADANGVASTMQVNQPGKVARVEVPVTILHTWVSDLKVSLTSPKGTTVVLYDGSGDSSDNLILTFTHHTVKDLTKFKGEFLVGTWKLRVVDRSGGDVGRLVRWGLHFEQM